MCIVFANFIQQSVGKNKAPLKGVIPHGMGKCHEVTKGTAR